MINYMQVFKYDILTKYLFFTNESSKKEFNIYLVCLIYKIIFYISYIFRIFIFTRFRQLAKN